MTRINTKRADKRPIRFESFDDILADMESIERSHNAGTLRTSGNWGPGQIFAHLAKTMDMSIDGADFKIPTPLKLVAKVLRGRFLTKGLMPGFNAPVSLDPGDVTFDDGISMLRDRIAKVQSGTQMTQDSPVLGRMSHDDWVKLHLRHSELHMGFVHPGAED